MGYKQDSKIKENNKITIENNKIIAAKVGEEIVEGDIFVSGADYQHTDEKLLKENANYSDKYWDKRTMAPSCLLFYVGINKRVTNLQHHNLFFDESLDFHGKEIYKDPKWPTAPLFYLCVPSLSDASVAPENCENMFFLINLFIVL